MVSRRWRLTAKFAKIGRFTLVASCAAHHRVRGSQSTNDQGDFNVNFLILFLLTFRSAKKPDSWSSWVWRWNNKPTKAQKSEYASWCFFGQMCTHSLLSQKKSLKSSILMMRSQFHASVPSNPASTVTKNPNTSPRRLVQRPSTGSEVTQSASMELMVQKMT